MPNTPTTVPDFTSPAWRAARFEIETEADISTCVWIVATMPTGVSAKIAYCNNAGIAELICDSLLLAQAAYAQTSITLRTANGNLF